MGTFYSKAVRWETTAALPPGLICKRCTFFKLLYGEKYLSKIIHVFFLFCKIFGEMRQLFFFV